MFLINYNKSLRFFYAENTDCILENPLLCHFHNEDFEAMTKRLNTGDSTDFYNAQKILSASLSDKYNSCVRQLLNNGKY